MSLVMRWLRFNVVGILGFALQTMTLWILVRHFQVTASVAIAVAVLATVSHNFFWHERITWPGLPQEQRCRRWLAFNASVGVFSVVTNVALTLLVSWLASLPLVPANVVAVAVASTANFWVSDRLIFRPPQ